MSVWYRLQFCRITFKFHMLIIKLFMTRRGTLLFPYNIVGGNTVLPPSVHVYDLVCECPQALPLTTVCHNHFQTSHASSLMARGGTQFILVTLSKLKVNSNSPGRVICFKAILRLFIYKALYDQSYLGSKTTMTTGEWSCLISFAWDPLTCSERRGGSEKFKMKIYVSSRIRTHASPRHD